MSTGVPIDASPSTSGPVEYVGLGTAGNGATGGYAAYRSNGTNAYRSNGTNAWGGVKSATDVTGGHGVDSGLTVANLEGQLAVVSGSMGQNTYALNAASGTTLAGWPFLNADSDFASNRLAASDGGIFAFGGAGFHGSTGGVRLAQPVVGLAGY